MDVVHWYVIAEGDVQQGPFLLSQIQDQIKQGQITLDHFVWHEELDGWDRLSNVIFRGRPVVEILQGSTEPVPAPVKAEVTPPAASRLSKNFVYEESKDSRSSRKSNLVSGWSKEETEAGLVYYHNLITGEVRFSAPHSQWQVFFDRECVWVPDSVEGYIPATVLQRIGLNEKLKVQRYGSTMQMDVVGKALEGTFALDRDSYHSLKHVTLTQDLLLINQPVPPSILHNIKGRFEANQIYTRLGSSIVAVNPYKALPLYTDKYIERVKNK
jgi:hypothetical protein